VLSTINRALRRDADRVVAIGRDMRQRLIDLGTTPASIVVIPNWADGERIRPLIEPSRLRLEMGWGDRFVVMHSGNVELSQSLGTLLDAAEDFRGDDDFLFAVIGDGASKAALMEDAKRRGLTNVEFLPYQAKESLQDSLGAADVHVIGLTRGLAGFIVPSKMYGIMAVGRPFVAAVEPDTEPAFVIHEAQCGVRVDPDDGVALAEALLKIRTEPLDEMGARGRAVRGAL
jgi:colanic acid biosynthesis glycosyl transferase WcaI